MFNNSDFVILHRFLGTDIYAVIIRMTNYHMCSGNFRKVEVCCLSNDNVRPHLLQLYFYIVYILVKI